MILYNQTISLTKIKEKLLRFLPSKYIFKHDFLKTLKEGNVVVISALCEA